MYSSVVFSANLELYYHYYSQTPEYLLLQKETTYSLVVTDYSQPLATTNLPSISMDLSILDILRKWNHTLYGLLCLVPFT